jgi:hypothetical protein
MTPSPPRPRGPAGNRPPRAPAHAEPDQRVDLLHRNIQRHGTIFNTIAAACEVTGTITAHPIRTQP